MSSGGSSGVEFGSGGEFSDCNIIKKTALASPVPVILKTIKPGDRLVVALVKGSRVEVEAPTGSAGGLAFRGIEKLIDCMKKGHKYSATVLSIHGAICEIELRPD